LEKVLVTGGMGFIGYHLCQKLINLKADVSAYGKLTSPRDGIRLRVLKKIGVKPIIGDILQLDRLSVAARGASLICHLAAKSSVSESREDPIGYFQTNVVGTLNVLEVARKTDAMVILASSSTVYGNPIKTPTPEDHPLQPISFYGLSKLLAEKCCAAYQSFGLRFTCLRFFNVYGPEGGGVIYDFLRKIQANNERLEIIGSGRQSKDFVYVEDVVEAIIAVAQHKSAYGQVYNIGSGTTTNVVSLARTIIELLGLQGKTQIHYGLQESWPGDVSYTHSDVTKIKREIGWEPKVPLKAGILKTIDWYEKEWGPIKH